MQRIGRLGNFKMTRTLLSLGHGFSAEALGAHLLQKGWRVIGTTRSDEKAARLVDAGIEALIWPGVDLGPYFEQASHVLSSIAPRNAEDPILENYREELRTGHFDWVGYLSTTGVYGDHQGGWVDEETALTPATERGIWRKQAEAEWAALNVPLHIFRLAGIYGPGRGPFAKVRAGTARQIIKSGQVFSRIHVEDIAQVLAASIARPRPGAVYNLCDDDPAPPQDVLAYAAELLGVTLPPPVDYDKAEMTPMARSFYAESKRVRNDLIKQELGVVLKYPNYRIGLQALLERENAGD